MINARLTDRDGGHRPTLPLMSVDLMLPLRRYAVCQY